MGVARLVITFKSKGPKVAAVKDRKPEATPDDPRCYLSDPKLFVEQSLWYGHSPQCVYRIPHPYCDHVLCSSAIEDLLVAILANLRRFELRVRETAPRKAKARQRLVTGVAECLRFVRTKGAKLAMLMVAVDVEERVWRTAEWRELLGGVRRLEKPIAFGMTKRELSAVLGRQGCTTSVVAIINAEGAFEEIKRLNALLAEGRAAWREAAVSLLQDDVTRTSGTLLSLLALHGHFGVINVVGEMNRPGLCAVVNHVDSASGTTPMMMAALGGHEDVLGCLLSLGGDPWARDFLGQSSLHKVVASGSVSSLKLLMTSHPDALDHLERKSFGNQDCLDIAVAEESLEMCQILVQYGVRISMSHMERTIRTPKPLVEIFHLLLQNAGRLERSELALLLARISATGETNYWRGLREFLTSKYSLPTPDLVALLDDLSLDGQTCAWRAAQGGHRALARMLLRLGCEASFRCNMVDDGRSVLEILQSN